MKGDNTDVGGAQSRIMGLNPARMWILASFLFCPVKLQNLQ